MAQNKYKFKQAELYTIAYLVVSLVEKLLTNFTAFKGKYTATWAATANSQIEDAEEEPNENERSAKHSLIRTELSDIITSACNKFNALERYIIEVYPPTQQPIQIDAAGGSYYEDAYNEDLDSCRQLLINACEFAEENETTLLNAGSNMPATFRTELEAIRDNFIEKHGKFLEEEVGAEVGTGEKINLNNAVYEQFITAINADAQVIFAGEASEEIRKQFTVEHQLKLVRGAGVAGIAVRVRTTGNTPVAGAQVIINPGNFTLTTDGKGRARKLQLAAGNYTVTITKEGFTPQTLTVEVETGHVKRVNVTMEAV